MYTGDKNMRKKIVTQVTAVILFLFILITSLITLYSSIKASNLAFLKYRFYIMETDTQQEIANKGDLVIAKKLKNGEIQAGDYIVYGDNEFYYCDEIVETKKINTVTKIITAERNGIKYQFSEDEVSGKIVKKINKLGEIIKFLRTPVAIVIFILFVICIFALLRISISKRIGNN